MAIHVRGLGVQDAANDFPGEPEAIEVISDDDTVSDSDSGDDLEKERLIESARWHEAAMFPASRSEKFAWMRQAASRSSLKQRAKILNEYDTDFVWRKKYDHLRPLYVAVKREAARRRNLSRAVRRCKGRALMLEAFNIRARYRQADRAREAQGVARAAMKDEAKRLKKLRVQAATMAHQRMVDDVAGFEGSSP